MVEANSLLRGEETGAFGDAGYSSVAKRPVHSTHRSGSATKSGVIAEYAQRDTGKPIGLAKYRMGLPAALTGELPSVADIVTVIEGEKVVNGGADPVAVILESDNEAEKRISVDRVASELQVISRPCQARPVVEIEPCARPEQHLLNHASLRRFVLTGHKEFVSRKLVWSGLLEHFETYALVQTTAKCAKTSVSSVTGSRRNASLTS